MTFQRCAAMIGMVFASIIVLTHAQDGVWEPWSQCSQTCDSGTQQRLKYCNGNPCGKQVVGCNIKECEDIFANSEWSECSEECGDDGVRERTSDDGQVVEEIRCNTFSCDTPFQNCSADILFVIDSSGSITDSNYWIVKQFCIDIVKGLLGIPNQTRIGIVRFSTDVSLDLPLDNGLSVDDLVDFIWNLDFMADVTNTAEALQVMRQESLLNGRADKKQMSIVLTDGASNINPDQTIPEAELAKAKEDIIVIGVTSEINLDELEGIASSDEFVYSQIEFDTLQTVTNQIIEATCDGVIVVECDPCFWDPCPEPCGVTHTQTALHMCTRTNLKTGESSTFETLCTDLEPNPRKCFEECPTTTISISLPCDACKYGPCEAPCGFPGLKQGSQQCQEVNTNTGVVIREYTKACAPEVCVSPPCPDPDDCARCDYTKGQIWLEHENCHQFYVCEKIAEDEYRKHEMTCGELFWDQNAHTCVTEPPNGDPDCGILVTYPHSSTTKAPCPYLPLVGDAQSFALISSPQEVQKCKSGFEFMVEPCTCIPVDAIKHCEDQLLLDFPFDEDFNDHTCHEAIGDPCGEGELELVEDPERDGKVLRFGGGIFLEVRFMQTWFADNEVDEMSISLWFKRAVGTGADVAGLVNNGDCEDDASFEVNVDGDGVYAGIGTELDQFRLSSIAVNEDKWYHAVWVYDGSELKFYLNGPQPAAFNGVPVASGSVAGYMKNPDVPLYMGFLDGYYFIGYLDDVRVWERVLDVSEIQNLYNEA